MKTRIASLNEGESDCLRLVSQGYSSKQIVRLLPYPISKHTVDQRLRVAIRKLQAQNRQEAARLFMDWSEDGTYHPVIYQPEALVSDDPEAAIGRNAAWGWFRPILKTVFSPLPIGGQDNDLTWKQRTLEIIRVAAFSIVALLGLVLAIAGAFSAFT